MERIINKKEQADYLGLIVKKISKDRLSAAEWTSYQNLKGKVDPGGDLEKELSLVWDLAAEADVQHLSKSNIKKLTDNITSDNSFLIYKGIEKEKSFFMMSFCFISLSVFFALVKK